MIIAQSWKHLVKKGLHTRSAQHVNHITGESASGQPINVCMHVEHYGMQGACCSAWP